VKVEVLSPLPCKYLHHLRYLHLIQNELEIKANVVEVFIKSGRVGWACIVVKYYGRRSKRKYERHVSPDPARYYLKNFLTEYSQEVQDYL
jgi:hypothetical protein